MGFFTILLILLLLFVIFGFYFFKSSKEMPKTWYEWKTEFRLQYIGITGLVQDNKLKLRNQVELFPQPGRVAVITGGNRGIGLIIIKKLLECEMTVIMGVRDPKSAEVNILKVVDLSKTSGKLIIEKLDVGSLESVREFGKKVQEDHPKIDLLFNNAGIMFAPFELSKDGYESHFAINYLGHFLLTHLLLPQLKKGGSETLNSRIVNVSSIVNIIGRINYNDINGLKRYYPATAYNQSKLAQILFTMHLNKYLEDQKANVQVHAVHPGVVDTDLFKHSATTAIPGLKKLMFKTPEEGSTCVLYAAMAPKLEKEGGTYLSNCVRAPCNPDAKKPEKCSELFEYTCKLLNIENYGDEANLSEKK